MNQHDTEVTQYDLETTCQELHIQFVAVEAQLSCGGGMNGGTSTVVMKLPKFDESTSWMVYHYQFGVVADHCSWAAHENPTHLLTILQGQATNILHSDPAEATHEDTTGAPKGHYQDHQLVWPTVTTESQDPAEKQVATRNCNGH